VDAIVHKCYSNCRR